MKNIEIDDEVFTYLQSNALAYVENTPNKTLRRLFGLDSKTRKSEKIIKPHKKRPRTDLTKLVIARILENGQELQMYDYQKRIIPSVIAKIDGKYLLFQNQRYSMSQLAKIKLNEHGYASNEVRGPEFWYTSEDISIRTLWDRYLNENTSCEKR